MYRHRILNDGKNPVPLPLRAPPSPDEDLLSILRRCAARMGYPDLRWLLRPAEGKWTLSEKEIPLLSAERDYRILERLLLLSREELHSHTLHRFAPYLEDGEGIQQPPGQDPVTTNLPQLSPLSREAYFLPVSFVRVCPLCLQEPEGYDRLYWRVRSLFHCPLHRVQLLEKCPSCRAPITAHRPSPHSCPRCQHGDYRAADAVPLSPESPIYLGEWLLLKAFGSALPANETASRSLAGSPLFTLPGVSYLYLLTTVTSRLEAVFSQRQLVLLMHLLCAFSPEEYPPLANLFEEKTAVVFFLFHWLFLAWPTHFCAFLDAWYSLSTPPFTGKHPEGVLSTSRSLFFDRFEPDTYAWLRQVYQNYHQQFRQDPDRIDHFRNSINLLARSIRSPQRNQTKPKRRGDRDEERLYIPPRLLTPTVPYPWENLGSVLSRAAKKINHPYPEQLLAYPYFSPRTLSELTEDEVPFPGKASQSTLAYLLQIPKEEIPRLTGSDLIHSLDLPRYNVLRRHALLTESCLRSWLLPHLHDNDTTRLCPDCLEEREGYDRVFWNLRGVLCCPQHMAHLLEKCPACLQAIPAIRPQTNQCPFCSRATYQLSAKHVSKNSVLAAGTNLLLMKLGIPLPEAAAAFQFFGPSPLLEEKPSVYFALLIELTEEVGSYYAYSREQLLQLCHILGEHTIPPAQTNDDPYVIDAEVVLFHTLFSRWPQRFFAFLDLLHQKALAPVRAPRDVYARWRWLLTDKWEFIAPDWLFGALEEYECRHRRRVQRVISISRQGQIGGNFSTRPDTPSS